MLQATDEHTTSTRRAALRGTANALLAGLLAPRLASAAPADNPDAASLGVGGVPMAARSTKLTTPPHPDAELLALAEFYFAGQPVIDAWNRGEIAEEEAEPIDARLIEAVRRMAEIPAATMGAFIPRRESPSTPWPVPDSIGTSTRGWPRQLFGTWSARCWHDRAPGCPSTGEGADPCHARQRLAAPSGPGSSS